MTITNPPSASSQIELGKSHYLIRSLGIRRLVWGELAFGLNYASVHTDVLLRGHTYDCVCVFARHFSLLWIKCMEKQHPLITHISTLPSKPNLSYIKVRRAPPLCAKPAGRRGCVCVPGFSQSSSATVPSRWPTVIWRSDFMGPSEGATVTVTNCAYRPPLDKDHITDGLGAGARRGRHRS